MTPRSRRRLGELALLGSVLVGLIAAALTPLPGTSVPASPQDTSRPWLPPVAAAWTDSTHLRVTAAAGEDYQVSTIAGDGRYGYVDGPALAAEFRNDVRIAADASGNLYIVDVGNAAIRKLTPGGIVSTLAGNGSTGYADGTGTAARFLNPSGIAVDPAGILYVSEGRDANRIRRITPAGTVSTFAGSTVIGVTTGWTDSNQGLVDGTGTAARFAQPAGLAFDTNGNLYVADAGNHVIRRITPGGVVSTYAGSGIPGYLNGNAATAQFDTPSAVAVDAAGSVYVGDSGNFRIRRIAPDGTVSDYAGSGVYGSVDGMTSSARFMRPSGVSLGPDGMLYVADGRLRAVSPAGLVTTIWSRMSPPGVDGPISTATFAALGDVLRTTDGWVVADNGENLIRRLVRSW